MTGNSIEILAVIRDRGFYQQIEAFMARSDLKVTRVDSGSESLPLASHHLYDLIVTQHPLPDLTIHDFFASIRQMDSASAKSPALVLTRLDQVDELDPYLDGALVQACCVDAPGQSLHRTMADLLGVAPRVATRLFLGVKVRLDETERVFQTINLSESGALVHAERPLEIGFETAFSLESPWDPVTIGGTARVVRHTHGGRESESGFALCFLSLDAGGRASLANLVERHGAQLAH